MHTDLIEELNKISREIRIDIIDMLYKAGSGHPGGSLSEVEILVSLYFSCMNIDPQNPDCEERDRFILSKGHAAPGLYAVLARKGYFSREELFTLRKVGSRLQGHPDMKKTPGVDFSTGSLGQGLSIGTGMALGSKLSGLNNRIFVLLGDGELNEGQNWEAIMAAAKLELNNLTAIVDRNRVQLDGTSNDIMPLEPLAEKWAAFNWKVFKADGHDIGDLIFTIKAAGKVQGMPSVIIADTVKGKGISFMENKFIWHGKPIDKNEYRLAMEELANTNLNSGVK